MLRLVKALFRNRRGAAISARVHANGNGSAPYYAHLSDGARVEIIRAARAAGSETLPDTAARELDDVQGAVLQEHQRQHRDALEHARGELRDLTDAFDRLE